MVRTKVEDLQRCKLAQCHIAQKADLRDGQLQHRGAKHGDQFLNANSSTKVPRKMELSVKTLLDTDFLQLVQQLELLVYHEHRDQLLSGAHDQAQQT